MTMGCARDDPSSLPRPEDPPLDPPMSPQPCPDASPPGVDAEEHGGVLEEAGSDESSDEGDQFEPLEEDDEIDLWSRGIPAEVNVPFGENDDYAPCQDSDGEGEDSDAEAVSDEELPEAESESDEEDSQGEEDSEEEASEAEADPTDDESSAGSAASSACSFRTPRGGDTDADHHELFLPWDLSPSVQSLKYAEDEEGGDEDSSDEDEDEAPPRSRRRLWDGCPAGASVSSDSSSSGGSCPSPGDDDAPALRGAGGVSFDRDVIVYPVFPAAQYSPAMLRRLYTGRDELRANKARNKREFAYDGHSWRDAAEEDAMVPADDGTGELVHPAHHSAAPASSLTWGGLAVRRGKRTRLCRP